MTIEDKVLEHAVATDGYETFEPDRVTEDKSAHRVEPQQAPIDVNAWFSQRDQIIQALQDRRKHLLEELVEIDTRLVILGVRLHEQDKQPVRKAASKSKPKPVARSESSQSDRQKVLSVLTHEPQHINDILTKSGMSSRNRALDILVREQLQGNVVRSQRGGTHWCVREHK